jgi:hypothetical protein
MVLQVRPELFNGNVLDTASGERGGVDPKELSAGAIGLNYVAVTTDAEIPNRGELPKISIECQLPREFLLVLVSLLELQIQFYLMHLQLVQQAQRIVGAVFGTGQTVQKLQDLWTEGRCGCRRYST